MLCYIAPSKVMFMIFCSVDRWEIISSRLCQRTLSMPCACWETCEWLWHIVINSWQQKTREKIIELPRNKEGYNLTCPCFFCFFTGICPLTYYKHCQSVYSGICHHCKFCKCELSSEKLGIKMWKNGLWVCHLKG